MDKKFLNKFSTTLLYFSILAFIIAFNFAYNPPVGWYQQFLPNLNGMPLSGIVFIDSLNGFGMTDNDFKGDTGYIVKTTNGGDNWSIVFKDNRDFKAIQFLNLNTGFVCGAKPSTSGVRILKTTNSGINWFDISSPSSVVLEDLFALNEDTIWVAASVSLTGGLYRTTNGGISWTRQFSRSSIRNPAKVYMANRNLGFITDNTLSELYRTTNSGNTWTLLNGQIGFRDMYFSDSLLGWKAYGGMRKTTDGGLTWIVLDLPPEGTPVLGGGYILKSNIRSFSKFSKDTIWGVGSYAFFGFGQFRGLIYKTTNGGETWGYQLPDTSITISNYGYVTFTNSRNGWAYSLYGGVHTVTGGDSTIYTSVNKQENEVPEEFLLHQNYPNPFNPKTIINYELRVKGKVSLRVYNLLGTELKTFVNEVVNSGAYEIEFDGSDFPSGLYFYSLFIDGKIMDTKKMILIR